MDGRVAAAVVFVVLTGSIGLSHTPASGSFEVVSVEVPFGKIVSDTTLGENLTEGNASVTGTLLSTTTDFLYLNNTNATGSYFVRLQQVDATGLANLLGLEVGIDNGTQTSFITVTSGSLTQTTASAIQLEPGSVNTIYVTQTVSVLGVLSSIEFDVYVADDDLESGYVQMSGILRIT